MTESKNIVITGGTSGLGKALALYTAGLGHHVAVVSRHADDLSADLREAGVIGIQADVSIKGRITSVVAEISAKLGAVDVLVNNASFVGPTPLRLLVDSDCEDLEQVLATNLLGPFRLTKALLGPMLLGRGGVVVNISSDAAVSAYETWGGYSISKAGLDHLSRIWDAELGEHGVRVLAVDPGDMNTPMHAAAIPDADFDSLHQPSDVARDLWKFLDAGSFSQVRYCASEWRAQ